MSTDDAANAGRGRGKRPPQGDPVVDRALGLLAAFDPAHRRLTLSDLARRGGVPLSTARRLAERLTAWGALEREPEGAYVVGLRLWEVASLAPRGLGMREAAMPFIEDLYVATRQHVQLAVREGTQALLVERRSGRGSIPVEYRVGGRVPLHATALGYVLLAHAPTELQESVLTSPLTWPDDSRPIGATALRRILAEVRQTSVAVINRRRPVPLVGVAAPVKDAENRVVAALSIAVPAGGADPRTLEPAVRATARAISRTLGAQLPSDH